MSAKPMPREIDTVGEQLCRDSETLIKGSDGTGTGSTWTPPYRYRFVSLRVSWGYAVWDNQTQRIVDGIYKDPLRAHEQAQFYNEEPEWADRWWILFFAPHHPMTRQDANESRKLLVSDLGLRFDILQRDNYRCQICGDTANNGARLEVDHKKARSKGGKDTPENLWTLCFSCNRGKGIKDY